MARTMIYDFTMPPHKKPAAVNKNRTAVTVAAEDINEKNMLNFNNEILQVLKQVHPNIPITCGALEVMNIIITNMMLKLAQKSYKRKNKSKLSSKDIMSAVMELFPPQMAKLACTAARKALTNRRVTNLTQNGSNYVYNLCYGSSDRSPCPRIECYNGSNFVYQIANRSWNSFIIHRWIKQTMTLLDVRYVFYLYFN
jgi:hypothetical protein